MSSTSEERPVATTPGTPEAALRVARTIVSALVLGVFSFWAVAWFVSGGGERPSGAASGFSPALAVTAWSALALATFAGALYFRSRAVGVIEEAQRSGGAPAVFARAGETQSFLIIAMSLLEAPALLAGVVFMLLGTTQLLLYAAPIYLLGAALVFPRAEWFGADPARGSR